jgi:DNA-directed RNA polymerase specialized sigma24 family protein
MVQSSFEPPRNAFLRAVLGSSVVPSDQLLERWTVLFAERVGQGWLPRYVLDWWLDRPGAWIASEVRIRFGASMIKSLQAGHRRTGGAAADPLSVDAMFAAAVLASVDACHNYDPDQPVGSWLGGVAYNTGRELARVESQRSSAAPLPLPIADLDPELVPDRRSDDLALVDLADEHAWLVARAVTGSALPGESLIVANILEGDRSAESIGDELSISVKRVYKRTAAARSRLREALARLSGL